MAEKYYTVEPPTLSVDYHQMYEMSLKLSESQKIIFYVDAGTHLQGHRTGNIGGTDQVYIGVLDPGFVPSDGFPKEDVPYLRKLYNSLLSPF